MSTPAITLRQLPAQAKAYAAAMNTKQRYVLAAATLATLLTLGFFVHIMQTPEMKVLSTGMSASEAQQLGAQLEAKKIQHEVSADGTVKVAADQLDNARLEMVANAPLQSGRLGFEIFDKPNWAGSEFSEHVNYQRALEGELEHTISTMAQVESARVHLVLAHESLFEDRERPGKAAVVLKLRSRRLEPEAMAAIQNLVASAVDGLRPQDVTVVGADDKEILSRPSGMGGVGDDLELAIANKVTSTLAPVVGEGKVRTSVTIERDTATRDDTEEIYDGKNAVPLAMQRSEQSSGAPQAGGVPGTASNLPSKAPNSALFTGNNKEQSAKTENGTYGVNRTVRHSSQPAGRIRRMTVAVLLDEPFEQRSENGMAGQTRSRSKDEIDRLTELARAAAGLDASRGDVLQLESMRFEGDGLEAAPVPTRIDRALQAMGRWRAGLRYLGIGLLFFAVYWFVLRPLRREAVSGLRLAGAKMKMEASGQHLEKRGTEVSESGEPSASRGILKKRVLERIEQSPDTAGKLLANWLKQGGGEA